MKKVMSAKEVTAFEQIPNVGKEIAKDIPVNSYGRFSPTVRGTIDEGDHDSPFRANLGLPQKCSINRWNS